ncbi:hypothetical protein XAP412_1030022 [Xanthomonas phaseoli pv. phaseoli]|uniref:Uncharacterized protein n=1 Tax=Xanthomonas campestris pv. phaseoli TaxID=317013 RepID=A0AB38DU76_XANCH|nr:hypothetical protein XAP412_1030022 [Xanthomonas phaseoli pv. phaseoli]SON75842.1 hypothetical protein XAP6984_1080022 [Xanthomonas phaseoli pv. phaseoli]SON77291.1 hypothetical protein XAP7430_1050023 [Xanthomonas phaseoli pv. phaseoli]SOO30466.1 hypothetical protein XAP6164_4370006 [Xanthomonas phaseoli pv. phaseoli]
MFSYSDETTMKIGYPVLSENGQTPGTMGVS